MEDVYFVLDEIDKEKEVEENQLLYLSPNMERGILKSAIRVSDGTPMGEVPTTAPVTPLEPAPHSEEKQATLVQASAVVEEHVVESDVSEDNLMIVDESYDLEEVEGEKVEGSAEDQGKEPQHVLQVQYIVCDVPRVKLAEATKEDTTLATANSLADSLAERYY